MRIEVMTCAASDGAGRASLHLPLVAGEHRFVQASLIAHGGDDYVMYCAPLRRLDDIAAGLSTCVSFVKIDVEEHALAVLRGASTILARDRPLLLVEIERRPSPTPIAETFAFLTGRGYTGTFLDDHSAPQPIAGFDPDHHQQPDGPGRYVNNFLFRPRR